jgi:hypothetical protein
MQHAMRPDVGRCLLMISINRRPPLQSPIAHPSEVHDGIRFADALTRTLRNSGFLMRLTFKLSGRLIHIWALLEGVCDLWQLLTSHESTHTLNHLHCAAKDTSRFDSLLPKFTGWPRDPSVGECAPSVLEAWGCAALSASISDIQISSE